MAEDQKLSTSIGGDGAKETSSSENVNSPSYPKIPWFKQYLWWIEVVIYTFFLLAGQAVGVLLGRLYFDKGGKSTWLATLVQTIGFPMLIPFLFIPSYRNHTVETSSGIRKPSILVLVLIYLILGICIAADSMLYSLGLKYLPVSTYSLVCASQLAFNAVFAYFLNAQKLTPFIINSLVLLTISSVVLVIRTDNNDSNQSSKNKYGIGVVCTVGASALFAFVLSFTELMFQKVLKGRTFRTILDLTIYESLFATLAILIGLFASGDWRRLRSDMDEYELGKVSYTMTLFWTAVSWVVFSIGSNGLIFKASSLFSNVISVVGLPITPVLAVIVFHDKVTGAKVVSLMLALWGFISYVYQHYLDDLKAKAERASPDEVSQVAGIQIN